MKRALPFLLFGLLAARAHAGTTQPPIDNCSGGAAAINPNCGGQGGNSMAGNQNGGGSPGGNTAPPGGGYGGTGGFNGGQTDGGRGFGGRGPGSLGAGSNPGQSGYANGTGSNPGATNNFAGGGAAGPAGAAAGPSSPYGAGNPLTIKAGVELQMGDYASACVNATAALKQDPNDAKAKKIVEQACRGDLKSAPKPTGPQAGQDGPAGRDIALDANKAGKLLRGGAEGGALATVPAELQALLARIVEAVEAGDNVLVVQLAEEGLKDHPGSEHLLNMLATALNKLGDHKGALAAADKAIAANDQNATAHANRAAALLALGDRNAAIEALERAAALDPRFEADLKKLLAAGASGLFGDIMARGGKLGALPWVIGAATLGFLMMVILVLLARRSGPQTASWTPGKPEAPAPAAATAIEPGALLGGAYRVEKELGRGGMGVVFSALDEKLQRRVAIKQLRRGGDGTAGDADRFMKEARVVAKLKHQNLAEIYTVLDEGGELLLVFEYVEGRGLDQVLTANRKLPVQHAVRVLQELAAGLDYAHGERVIHRDLKPANIMITKTGGVKIMDFGIAHQASGNATHTQTAAWGTPPYMAPEQALGSVSKAADLYSLAIIGYEMVVGARPFEGPDYQEQKLRRSFTEATKRDGGLPAALDGFFTAALDPDPTKRPVSAAALVDGFRKAAGA